MQYGRRDVMRGSLGAGMLALGGMLIGMPAQAADDELHALMKTAVGADNAASGILAVLVEGNDSRVISVGGTGVPGLAWTVETVGEIGSITKVMTALLLAEMVARGEVAFEDPVGRYLPPSLTLREQGGPITLLDLATYHSGLPNMPANMPPQWWENPNPFGEYTEDKLADFLAAHVPEHAPGTQYRYANLGFGLLGIALAHRAGTRFETLLVERICKPLGLHRTRITLDDAMRRHLAQGHDRSRKPAMLWDMPTLPGAGAVRSTAGDLTLFLRACMGLDRTSLDAAIARLLETRRSTSIAGTAVGLGWFVSSDEHDEIVWKSGLTGGFSSFLGYSTRTHRGAAILSNGFGVAGLGFRSVNPGFRPNGDLDALLR